MLDKIKEQEVKLLAEYNKTIERLETIDIDIETLEEEETNLQEHLAYTKGAIDILYSLVNEDEENV